MNPIPTILSKNITVILLSIISIFNSAVFAQTPMYSNGTPVNTSGNSVPFSYYQDSRAQLLIPPGIFGSVPSGMLINRLYFSAYAGLTVPSSVTFTNFEIRMGNTSQTSFTGTWLSGLTQALYAPTYVMQPNAGTWFAINLTTPIPYDPTQRLAIEVRYTALSQPNTWYLSVVVPGTVINRQYSTPNTAATATVGSNLGYSVGIDLIPGTIEGLPTFGLVGYYKFNGNAGDSSGYGNHGSVSGATLTSDRKNNPNGAFIFNGTSDFISVPASTSLQPPKSLSLVAWFAPDSVYNSTTPLLSKRMNLSTDPYDSYTITKNSNQFNDKWIFSAANSGTGTTKQTHAKSIMPYGSWNFVVATYDSSNLKIYTNGNTVPDTIVPFTGNIGYSSLNLFIGTNGAGQFYKGKIDELLIYNRALLVSEISQIYNLDNVYYSKSSGPLDSLGTWGKNRNGSGPSPLNFNTNNAIYNIVNNPAPSINSNWFISGSNTTVILGDGSINVNLNIPQGRTIVADSFVVRTNSMVSSYGELLSNKYLIDSLTTIEYLSSSPQFIPPVSFYNLNLNGGIKSLLNDTYVRNSLAFSVDINCNGKNLTLGKNVANPGILNRGISGTIFGRFSRWFSATTNAGASGLFPIGSLNIYRPLQIEYTTAPTNGGIISCEFISSAPGNLGLPLYDISISPVVTINKTAQNGYWKVDVSNGISGGTYTCSVTGTNFSGITNLNEIRLVRRNNSSSGWSVNGNSLTGTGTLSAPVARRSGLIVNGGDFSIASDSNINSLPVELLFLRASRVGNYIALTWSTASEKNNDYFEIERATGSPGEWKKLGQIKGKGTTNLAHTYKYIDNSYYKPSDKLYYRLKSYDFDGAFDISNTLFVEPDQQIDNLIVYPNPFQNYIYIDFDEMNPAGVEILDLHGRKIFSETINNHHKVDLEFIDNGIYTLFIKTQEKNRCIKLIKK